MDPHGGNGGNRGGGGYDKKREGGEEVGLGEGNREGGGGWTGSFEFQLFKFSCSHIIAGRRKSE